MATIPSTVIEPIGRVPPALEWDLDLIGEDVSRMAQWIREKFTEVLHEQDPAICPLECQEEALCRETLCLRTCHRITQEGPGGDSMSCWPLGITGYHTVQELGAAEAVCPQESGDRSKVETKRKTPSFSSVPTVPSTDKV